MVLIMSVAISCRRVIAGSGEDAAEDRDADPGDSDERQRDSEDLSPPLPVPTQIYITASSPPFFFLPFHLSISSYSIPWAPDLNSSLFPV